MKIILIKILIVAFIAMPVLAEQIIVYRPDGAPVLGNIDRRSGSIILNDMETGQVTTGYRDRLGNVTLFQGEKMDLTPAPSYQFSPKTPEIIQMQPGVVYDLD